MLNTLAINPQPIPLLIEGPYGSAKYFPHLANYDRILLVAGGVGATFTLPIYSHLQATASSDTHMRMVWIVRDLADTSWALDALDERSDPANADVRIHVTGSGHASSRIGSDGAENGLDSGKKGESIELQDRSETHRVNGFAGRDVRAGRPDLRAVVDDVFDVDADDRVAVLVCGPKGMGVALRKEVGRWVGSGRDVFWHSEEFGWGSWILIP